MSWRKFILRHWKAKIATLIIAVFLWFFVVTSRDYVHTFKIPIRTQNLRPDKVFLEAPPTYAQVRFQGRGTSLILLGLFGDPYLNLDLTGLEASHAFPLTIDLVRWTPTVDVQALEVVAPNLLQVQIGNKSAQ